jgi:hypothetical protein
LDHNRLVDLPPGVFDALDDLWGLELGHNQIQSIPSTTFRGLKGVVNIDISANNVSHPIEVGTFANPNLRFVSLAHNAIRSVEAGAFGKSLEHVWLTGNNLTCVGLAGVDGALPSDAGCTDEGTCDALFGIAYFGDESCDVHVDPRYNTAECMWDGGDCE